MSTELTAAHVKWQTLDYGYLYEIVDETQLHLYWTKIRGGKMRKAFAEGLDALAKNSHAITAEGSLFCTRCEIESYKDNPRSAVEVFCGIQDDVFRGMLRCLIEHRAIYVNPSGGYFTLPWDGVVIHRCLTKNLILPGTRKAKIGKWPGGVHWYATVDGVNIEYNGTNRWLTEEGANAAANEWLKERVN